MVDVDALAGEEMARRQDDDPLLGGVDGRARTGAEVGAAVRVPRLAVERTPGPEVPCGGRLLERGREGEREDGVRPEREERRDLRPLPFHAGAVLRREPHLPRVDLEALLGVGRREDAERLATWLGRQATDRNLKLFWASCRLAEGGVPLGDALDAMVTAAQSDFGEREITRTVYSAYRSVGAGARPDRPAASPSGEFTCGTVQQRAPATRGLP